MAIALAPNPAAQGTRTRCPLQGSSETREAAEVTWGHCSESIRYCMLGYRGLCGPAYSVQALRGGTEAHQQPGRPAIKPQWEEGIYTWDMLVIHPWKKGLEAKTDMFPSPDPLCTKT